MKLQEGILHKCAYYQTVLLHIPVYVCVGSTKGQVSYSCHMSTNTAEAGSREGSTKHIAEPTTGQKDVFVVRLLCESISVPVVGHHVYHQVNAGIWTQTSGHEIGNNYLVTFILFILLLWMFLQKKFLKPNQAVTIPIILLSKIPFSFHVWHYLFTWG